MSTRLRAQFPDLAGALEALSENARVDLVERIALHAASITGAAVPEGSLVELGQWATDLDETGWTSDSAGEPIQDKAAFHRARAAFAVRDACEVRQRPEAAADSLYECVMAIGVSAVRAHLA